MLRALASVAVAVIIVIIVLRWLEASMLYLPESAHAATPQQLGWAARDVWITTADGQRLHAWWIQGSGGRRRTLLFLHGNAGNISHRLDRVQAWSGLGLDFLLLDYRGFGKSAGRPSEEGLYLDAEAAYDHLHATEGVAPGDVVVFGESLGGGVALELARRRPAIGGVILENTFTSLRDMAKLVLPWLPRRMVRDGFDNLAKIGGLQVPLLIVHAQSDEIVPLRLGRALFEAAPEPKRLLVVPNASHNDVYGIAGVTYIEALGQFLDALP